MSAAGLSSARVQRTAAPVVFATSGAGDVTGAGRAVSMRAAAMTWLAQFGTATAAATPQRGIVGASPRVDHDAATPASATTPAAANGSTVIAVQQRRAVQLYQLSPSAHERAIHRAAASPQNLPPLDYADPLEHLTPARWGISTGGGCAQWAHSLGAHVPRGAAILSRNGMTAREPLPPISSGREPRRASPEAGGRVRRKANNAPAS